MRLLLIGILASSLIAAAPVQPEFDRAILASKSKMLSDPASSALEAVKALTLAEKARSRKMIATAKWLMGEARSRTESQLGADEFLSSALKNILLVEPGRKLHADILLSRGMTRSDIKASLADLQTAYKIFVRIGDNRGSTKCLIALSQIYARSRDYNSAIKYLDKIELSRNDNSIRFFVNNDKGNIYRELSNNDKSLLYYRKALEDTKPINSELLKSQVLANIATVLSEVGRLKEAQSSLKMARSLVSHGSFVQFMPYIDSLQALLFLSMNEKEKAGKLISERFLGIDLNRTSPDVRTDHEIAYRIYRAVGDDAKALAHLEALKRLDDQATELARSNSAALAAARFDFANQELRIARLKGRALRESVALERERARVQRLTFAGVAVVGALLMVLLGAIIALQRRARRRLAASNRALGKALRVKTEFLATTSHEIRTPLNGILGMTQVMLADTRVTGATRERIDVVHGAGVTMRALVDDILDVAKMETGKLTIDAAPFDAAATIRDAARIWRDQAGARGLAFDVVLEDCPGRIVGDDARLRQIVFNLLSNAVKFTPAGVIHVSATCDGERWQLAVRDTGIGIDPAHHEEIFDAFRQADAGTARRFGGTGLGLSICRSLSRAMGGDVTVDSRPGEGATFVLDLPLRPAPEEAAASNVAPRPAGLVAIERNPITRAMLKALGEARGVVVAFAATVEEWLAAPGDVVPATVLIDDVALRASADPVERIAAMRAAAPAARLVLIGPALDEEQRAALAVAGIDKFLARPVTRPVLVAALFGEPIESGLVTEAA